MQSPCKAIQTTLAPRGVSPADKINKDSVLHQHHDSLCAYRALWQLCTSPCDRGCGTCPRHNSRIPFVLCRNIDNNFCLQARRVGSCSSFWPCVTEKEHVQECNGRNGHNSHNIREGLGRDNKRNSEYCLFHLAHPGKDKNADPLNNNLCQDWRSPRFVVWRRTTLQKGTPCDSPPMLKPLSKPVPRFCVLVKAVPHENVPKNPPASEIAVAILAQAILAQVVLLSASSGASMPCRLR